jgi:hypothetical protein
VPFITRYWVVTCGSCILVVGIAALILGVTGYLSFTDPCVGMRPLSLEDLDLTSILGEEATNNQSSASMLAQIVTILLGMNSNDTALPSPLNVTIELPLLMQNTNPYDVSYTQNKQGTITIPASNMSHTSKSDNTEFAIPPEHEDDVNIGTWRIPDSTLKRGEIQEIPMKVQATVDLGGGGDGLGLVDLFMSPTGLMLRVEGEIAGTSWVPGLTGQTTLLCTVQVKLGHDHSQM